MEHKPRRYIIEMCNDFIKRYENAGNIESARKIDRTLVAYIHGYIMEMDVVKFIAEI